MAKGDFKKHIETCDQCVETAPGQWDLCETGQQLLVEEPGAENDL